MAEEPSRLGTEATAPSTSVSDQAQVLDKDDRMDDVDITLQEDVEEETQRYHRAPVARTMFRQRRGDDDTLNSIRSLYDDAQVVYFELYGRRYCKHYYMPNDEAEQTRLQMYNSLYYGLFNNRNTTVFLQDPEKILDIGTGTGDWAMAMGEDYPEAEVIGTDLAKIQPSARPLNVFFEIEDAEEEGGWIWGENEFDLVHFRYMCGAFADWKYIYKESFRCLKPGGWIEVIDFDDHKGALQYFQGNSEVHGWLSAIKEGSGRAGRPRTVQHLEPEYLASLGFTDVKCTNYDIPMGPWRDDIEGQTVGKHFLVATIAGIEAVSLRVLSEHMGWEYSEIMRLCEVVRDACWKTALDTEKSKGMSFRVKVLTGRKPGGSETLKDPANEAEDASTPRMMTTETNNENTDENST